MGVFRIFSDLVGIIMESGERWLLGNGNVLSIHFGYRRKDNKYDDDKNNSEQRFLLVIHDSCKWKHLI